MLNADQILAALANADQNTIVHLEYRAGSKGTAKAREEFEQACDWHKGETTTYVGNFSSVKRNKFGEPVVTLFCHNRGKLGNYRSFNPFLGEIRVIRVVQA